MISEPSHPKGQTEPVTVRAAFVDCPDDGTGDRVGTHTKIWHGMRVVRPGNQQPGHFSHCRLHFERSAPTIQKANGLAHYHVWHPSDAFKMAGKIGEAWDRIGNSVPPLLMRAITRHLRGLPPDPLVTQHSTYKAALDAAWQEHLAPRAPDAPTVISTFAGCGGSSLGYSMAGFRELLAVEWDDNAVQTFKLNFPEVPVYHGDIGKLSVEDVLRRTGLKPGELDVFDGSPPCQGFSTAGKREFGDKRNQLFREYVRLLRGLRPKVFVMENVSGMVKGSMKLIFAEILRELKVSGYAVKARLLNAMYFGVPQSRERMIFIGVRNDLAKEPNHPLGSSDVLTVKDALSEMPALRDHRPLSARVAAACKVAEPGWYPGGGKHGMGRALEQTSGTSSSGMSLAWLAWDRPSFTLMKQEIADSGTIHPSGERYIHPAEAQRLGSFPDSYRFTGSRKDALGRIGNCVPPLFMRSIARHIRIHLLQRACQEVLHA